MFPFLWQTALDSNASLRSKRFCAVREQRITGRSFFGSRPIFRAGKIPKTSFLGLSLLPNPTETLATQAFRMPAARFSFCSDTINFSLQMGRVTCNESCAIIPPPSA